MYKIVEENIDVDLLLKEVNSKKFFNCGPQVDLQKWDTCLYESLEYTNSLINRFNMYHTRLMMLKSTQCYSWHSDMAPRIHFPLITNGSCFFVLEDRTFTLPAGKGYWIDTRKQHSAFNGNKIQTNFNRWHIVGNTDEIF